MRDFVRRPTYGSRQGLHRVPLSSGRHASRWHWRRSTIALICVALLGAASAVREFDISIRNGVVEGGASTLRVNRGDTVLLRFLSDQAVSLHVHGYNLQVELPAASPTTIRFQATIAGRFPIAAHEFGAASDQSARPQEHREVTLRYLEVLPE